MPLEHTISQDNRTYLVGRKQRLERKFRTAIMLGKSRIAAECDASLNYIEMILRGDDDEN